jgi:hypothetical protein
MEKREAGVKVMMMVMADDGGVGAGMGRAGRLAADLLIA